MPPARADEVFRAYTASLKLLFALERTKSMSAEHADSCRAGVEALMAVKRIVPNIASDQPDKAKSFYAEMLDMDVVMDLGWIVTFAAASNSNPQVSVATEGGSRLENFRYAE